MIIKTKNSSYEFDTLTSKFRKTLPILEEWQPYLGFVFDPEVGKTLNFLICRDHVTITSTVINIDYES